MRIGILVSSMGNFGKKGFYNAQEIGMAKALAQFCERVDVYKLIPCKQETTEKNTCMGNLSVHYIPSKGFGINGLVDTRYLDEDLDALVYFSDTQISVPKVYRWAYAHNICFLPYIGVVQSHSTSKIVRAVINLSAKRNYRIYKSVPCLAKNPDVKERLEKIGVQQVTLAPVGLDLSLLKEEYTQLHTVGLKQKYGFCEEDRVLLFIGRLIAEKQPVRMIELFAEMHKNHSDFRLLMIGTGELRDPVAEAVEENGLQAYVRMIDKIPNADIWELYRIADAFVNLNQQEIFGMAILEAMYYGCKVVAWHAPGPDFIIEHGVSGYLEDSDEGIIHSICNGSIDPEKARERILNHFTWDMTARTIMDVIEQSKE